MSVTVIEAQADEVLHAKHIIISIENQLILFIKSFITYQR